MPRFVRWVALFALSTSAASAQEGRVAVGDAELRYELRGAGPVVVLIHGWAQDLEIWDDQVAALSPHYRVLRYDRRGYGRSTGHADRTADPDDLRRLLDSLHVDAAAVLGLSAGARVALDFAVAFPKRVSALVLYGLTPPDGYAPMPELPRPLDVFGPIAREQGLDSLGRVLMAHPLAWTPPEKPEARAAILRAWSRYDGRDLLDPVPPSGRVPQARMDQLAAIAVPTLVISGDHELPLFLAVGDTVAHRVPHAARVVIAGGGHGAHFAQPERFNAAVLDFLTTVYGRERRQ